MEMPTLVPFVRSMVQLDPGHSEDHVQPQPRNKGVTTKRQGYQSMNEFIMELVRSSSRVNHEGIVSLRMASNDVNPVQLSTSSRDSKIKMSGDSRTLIPQIEECFECFCSFANDCPPSYLPYLNGISFTLFIKSFIQIYDSGHKDDGMFNNYL